MTKYTGFVDGIRDGIAFVTVKDEAGNEFEGEFPANPDLRERRRFTLTIETVPDVEPGVDFGLPFGLEALLGDQQDDY